ncbi:MAG: esterase, partial [Salinivirgaceae bacterium]|nr:esterase [Salinivirgaceae bacterium]
IFSTGMFGGISGAANFDLEKECPGILSDTKTFNSKHDVFYISCGEQDPRIQYNKAIAEKMQQAGVNVQFNSFPGDHEWQPWRKSFADFAQKLFK